GNGAALSGGYMRFLKWVFKTCVLIVMTTCLLFCQSEQRKRDGQSVDILTRVVQAAGNPQAIASVHNITENGEVTFYWGEGVKGPLSISMLGAQHYRMKADLPLGKIDWAVNNGIGSKKTKDEIVSISSENALNLANLTFPLGHVLAALADPATEISFIGI